MSVMAFDHLAQFRARAAALLDANRPLLDAFLDAHPELECLRPPAGSIVFPRLPSGDTAAFFKLLREKYETTVVPGHFFEMPQHFRIGIGGDPEMVRAGLRCDLEATASSRAVFGGRSVSFRCLRRHGVA